MNNRSDESSDFNKCMMALVVLFIATILHDVTTGMPNLTWVMPIGTIVVGVSLSTMLPPDCAVDNNSTTI